MDSCDVSNKIFTKCFFIFCSCDTITWPRCCACSCEQLCVLSLQFVHSLKYFFPSCLLCRWNAFCNCCFIMNHTCGWPQRIKRRSIKGLLSYGGMKLLAIATARHLTIGLQYNWVTLSSQSPAHWHSDFRPCCVHQSLLAFLVCISYLVHLWGRSMLLLSVLGLVSQAKFFPAIPVLIWFWFSHSWTISFL